jgi:hypothetical protein
MWQHMFTVPVMRTKHMLPHNHNGLITLFYNFLNILILFNISKINKEINKKNSMKMISWEIETCWSAS